MLVCASKVTMYNQVLCFLYFLYSFNSDLSTSLVLQLLYKDSTQLKREQEVKVAQGMFLTTKKKG